MRTKIKGEYFDSAFLLNAIFVWLIASLVLLIIFSILLSELECTEKGMGYISSLISFLSALSAGVIAGRKRKSGTIYTALLTSSVLVTTLLTIGFMINGAGLEPSSVMSVISFSFSGCMVGTIFFSAPLTKRQHRFMR